MPRDLEAACIFCHDSCAVPNRDLVYAGCECTIPYHTHCIQQWFTKQGNECPLCRKVIRIDGQEDQRSNECALYMVLTVTINFILSCLF